MANKLVNVGALRGPHGLKGLVKAKIDLDDPDLLISAGPVQTADGASLTVRRWSQAGQGMLALEIDGVATVEAAEALKGALIFLERARFPQLRGEIYLDEVAGRDVVGPGGMTLGRVTGILDLPAGPAFEIACADGRVALVPVHPEFVDVSDDGVRLTELGVAVVAL